MSYSTLIFEILAFTIVAIVSLIIAIALLSYLFKILIFTGKFTFSLIFGLIFLLFLPFGCITQGGFGEARDCWQGSWVGGIETWFEDGMKALSDFSLIAEMEDYFGIEIQDYVDGFADEDGDGGGGDGGGD